MAPSGHREDSPRCVTVADKERTTGEIITEGRRKGIVGSRIAEEKKNLRELGSSNQATNISEAHMKAGRNETDTSLLDSRKYCGKKKDTVSGRRNTQ